MSADFYSTRRQFQREWRLWLGRFQPANAILGAVLILLSFYCLHSPGRSQVYEVSVPCLVAALHLMLVVITQASDEQTGLTAVFFRNLPRDRGIAFNARAHYFLGYALFYESLIGLGIVFKLGGAGITPIYRMHPEFMFLPFAAVLFSLWYIQGPRTLIRTLGPGAALALCPGLLILRYSFQPEATAGNNFIPPRDLSLLVEWTLALIMVGIAGGAAWSNRAGNIDCEGETRYSRDTPVKSLSQITHLVCFPGAGTGSDHGQRFPRV